MTMLGTQIVRFARSDRGTVAIMFAFLIGVLMMFAGLALDMARMLHVRQVVQSSLDAAALAAAKRFEDPSVTDDEIRQTAKLYFEANIGAVAPHMAKLTNFTATPDKPASRVLTTVDVELPTLLTPGGLGHVTNLTFAPKAGTTYSQTRIEVALVLDITGSMLETTTDGRVKIGTLRTAAKEFADVLYAGSPRPGFVRVALVPYAASVNAGSVATQVAGPGLDDCVVERSGFQAYTDLVAGAINRLGRMSAALSWRYSCPGSAVKPLSDLGTSSARAAFDAAIDSLQAAGGTAGHIGVAWGWYVLSSNWSAVWGANAGAPPSQSVRKVIVLMTDGMFNTSYDNGGLLLSGPEATDPGVAGSSPYQALKLCRNMQAGGDITIYTVGFATPPEAKQLLKSCGGDANFYDATDSNKLSTAFRNIASKLVSLRLSS